MAVTLRYPTPLTQLLADKKYSKYFSRKPKMPNTVSLSPNWLVLAHTQEGGWKRKLVEDYIEAQELTLKLSEKDQFRDVCLFSRRKIFRPPSWMTFEPFEQWCPRCRRPTLFQKYYGKTHHAFPDAKIWLQGEIRCYFCGVREEFVDNVRRSR